jgi:GDP-4-dehydro-6-deoxy-D-mannose reductase
MPIWKSSVRKNKVFITGIAGFVGSYLTEYLLEKNCRVFGLLAPGEKTDNIRHLSRDIDLVRFDLLNGKKLTDHLKKIKPEYIFHLAAFSSVGQSFDNERKVYDINFNGTLNLIESARSVGKELKRFVFISSSDVYGHFSPAGKTLTEEQPFNPVSPYAVSKAAGEYLVRYHVKKYGFPGVTARPFNHTGPRQADNFVVPSFCRQVAEIEKAGGGTMMVGDLSAKRDLSDVRDIVSGYYLTARKGKPGEVYQFCSGRSVAIKTILDKLVKLSDVNIKVKIDKSRFRKTDIPVLRGSNKKAVNQLGWNIRYKLNETIADTMRYWRMKIN